MSQKMSKNQIEKFNKKTFTDIHGKMLEQGSKVVGAFGADLDGKLVLVFDQSIHKMIVKDMLTSAIETVEALQLEEAEAAVKEQGKNDDLKIVD